MTHGDRERLSSKFVGMPFVYLRTEQGWQLASRLAAAFDLQPKEMSVVFTDDKDQVIVWIGPTFVLPPNAKRHAPLTS
jgi:hypothetical protein